jgi:polyadenylate-binding protein
LLNNERFLGHDLSVAAFQKGKDHINEEANLYVKNIPAEMTQKELADKFETFGPLVSVKLERYPDGKSKEYGYVQFERVEDAAKATGPLDWDG